MLGLLGCDEKPKRKQTPSPTPPSTQTPRPSPHPTPAPTPPPTPPPTPTPEPPPTPVPTPYVPQKTINVGSIFSGINFRTKLETVAGGTATAGRSNAESYTVEVNVKLTIPKPHRSMEELAKLNTGIGTLLPELETMLGSAKVSQQFDELYRRKVTSIRSNLDRLDQLISRHNFFDCETYLEIQNPKTKRKALLIQADMDVDTDGTDGDRVPSFEPGSRTFQPFTSYRWKKRTATPNPCTPHWEKRIADNEQKIKDPKSSSSEVQKLKSDNARLRMELRDLQTHSFLIGGVDPFIVLPTQVFGAGKGGFTPRIGDFCVVLFEDVFYPAIVGDAGPTTKMGEASLRLCRQINARANGEFRAVNDLKVTYIVFPGSGDKEWGPPNLLAWQTRCEVLLKELGNHTGKFFLWEQPPPPPPAATPTPVPAPAESPKPVTPPIVEPQP